jgi:hypothetical protein
VNRKPPLGSWHGTLRRTYNITVRIWVRPAIYHSTCEGSCRYHGSKGLLLSITAPRNPSTSVPLWDQQSSKVRPPLHDSISHEGALFRKDIGGTLLDRLGFSWPLSSSSESNLCDSYINPGTLDPPVWVAPEDMEHHPDRIEKLPEAAFSLGPLKGGSVKSGNYCSKSSIRR